MRERDEFVSTVASVSGGSSGVGTSTSSGPAGVRGSAVASNGKNVFGRTKFSIVGRALDMQLMFIFCFY